MSVFLIKIVLIIQWWCFSCCRAVFSRNRGLFYFSRCPTKRGGWGCGSWGGCSRGSWPRLATGVFWTTGWVSCSALKAGGYVCQGCSCLGAAWVLVGWWWAIEFYFTCSSWFCFSLCVRLFCSPQNLYETYEFSHFCPLILSPIPLWGEWVGGGVVLNHNAHFWHPVWGTDEITDSTRVHWRKFKITISVLQFLVAIFAYLLSTLVYLVHAMDFLFCWELVKGCFWLFQFAVMCSTLVLFCLKDVWQKHWPWT